MRTPHINFKAEFMHFWLGVAFVSLWGCGSVIICPKICIWEPHFSSVRDQWGEGW